MDGVDGLQKSAADGSPGSVDLGGRGVKMLKRLQVGLHVEQWRRGKTRSCKHRDDASSRLAPGLILSITDQEHPAR